MVSHDTFLLHHPGGRPNNVNDGYMLAIRTGYAVDSAELANAVSCDDGPWNAFGARMAVGRIGCVEFVAGANPLHVRHLVDMVEKVQAEVPRDPQDMVDAE